MTGYEIQNEYRTDSDIPGPDNPSSRPVCGWHLRVVKVMEHSKGHLPLFICGPMIRRLTPDQIVLWWVSPKKITPTFECNDADTGASIFSLNLSDETVSVCQVGKHAFVHLANIRPPQDLPCDIRINYDLCLSEDGVTTGLADLIPHIVYPGQKKPCFVVRKRILRFFNGSCRKPHHESDDTLIGLDKDIESRLDDMETRPAFLMLTGDQIYSDDVAGPMLMLQAIHAVIGISKR